jgi:hypothetical protein
MEEIRLKMISRMLEKSKKDDNWPKSVEEAAARIISAMPESDKIAVRNTKKDDLIRYVHGWGTGIRNAFGLWYANKDLLISACGETLDPKRASMVIIEAVWEKLHMQHDRK